MDWFKKTAITASAALASGLLVYNSSYEAKPKMETKTVAAAAFVIPDSIDFAGERAPLKISDVKERFRA